MVPHIANGIFLWMSCPTYTDWPIKCCQILLIKIIITFLTSNLSSQVKHSILPFQEDLSFNPFIVIYLILIKIGMSLMTSVKSFWDILSEQSIKLLSQISTITGREKLHIPLTIIQLQYTSNNRTHKFLLSTLIHQ